MHACTIPGLGVGGDLLLQGKLLGGGSMVGLQAPSGKQLLELPWWQQVLQAVLQVHTWSICVKQPLSALLLSACRTPHPSHPHCWLDFQCMDVSLW